MCVRVVFTGPTQSLRWLSLKSIFFGATPKPLQTCSHPNVCSPRIKFHDCYDAIFFRFLPFPHLLWSWIAYTQRQWGGCKTEWGKQWRCWSVLPWLSILTILFCRWLLGLVACCWKVWKILHYITKGTLIWVFFMKVCVFFQPFNYNIIHQVNLV